MTAYANELVEVEKCKNTFYVYCSELGCLRIFAKYNNNGAYHNKNARVGYSQNLKTWFFSLDSNI